MNKIHLVCVYGSFFCKEIMWNLLPSVIYEPGAFVDNLELNSIFANDCHFAEYFVTEKINLWEWSGAQLWSGRFLYLTQPGGSRLVLVSTSLTQRGN